MPSPLRVALCDDHDMVRESLASFIATDPNIVLVGSYATGEQLLHHLQPGSVDVVLLDVRMPDMDGPAVARHLARRTDKVRVLYLSSYPDEIPVTDALDGTVLGALTKDLAPDDLTRAIHLAASGVGLLSNQVRHHTADLIHPGPRLALAHDNRERDVLQLLLKGYTNDQIATQLNRSASSVKQILSGLCHRAGVRTRTELVLHLMDSTFTSSSGDMPRH